MPRAPDLTGVALDGRYELLELLGEGTFGRVYRGRDRRLARDVAIKVIKPWWAEDPEWVGSFEREAQLLASISDPGIVQIYDVGSAPEGHYYVAELVHGESLARRIARGALSAEQATKLAAGLCRALARAHADHIVHRDVKPENVLISRTGQVKVGDFGVARLAQGSSGAGATAAGTPRYMAPEQAKGGRVTAATDVYGVGVVLYEMLAGAPPFAGSTAIELALAHLNEAPPPLPSDVPAGLGAVVERALAKQPARRYRDGAEMAAALEAVGGGAETPADEEPEATETIRPGTPGQTRGRSGAGTTQVGDPRGPRRNMNPSERRQRIALFTLVVLIAVGLLAGGLVLARSSVRVPALRGLDQHQAATRLRRAGLRASFGERFSTAPAGQVTAQRPDSGASVGDGSTVAVLLSGGPPPVRVPGLAGQTATSARAALLAAGLTETTVAVPGYGAAPQTVLRQRPLPHTLVAHGTPVELSLAEATQWRALTAFAGTGPGRSVPFRIRGRDWRLRYSSSFQGTCTFIFFCSGPNATVSALSSARTVDSFGLSDGGPQLRAESAGPGLYQVSVQPGSDTARWQIVVDDHY